MATHVDASREVVEPVSGDESEEGGDDGGEVEEAFADIKSAKEIKTGEGELPICFKPKVIKWSKEDGKRSVDPHNPSKT